MSKAIIQWSSLFGAFLCLNLLAACSEPSEPENPIVEMLGHVPDNASEQSGWISYIDYEAALASRALSPITEQQAQDEKLRQQWYTAVAHLQSDFELQQFAAQSAAMREAVGFTIFDVRREVIFGERPGLGVVLAGGFDAASVEAALATRDYTESEIAGVTAWCGAVGCEGGLNVDPPNRNPANPFGGSFGRQEPIVVTADLLLNSADIEVFTALVETHSGDQPALSEHADYRALAEAAQSLGSTVQMHMLPSAPDYWKPIRLTDEADPAVAESLSDVGSLPEYSLFAMADIWDGEQQIAALMLVYDSANEAAAGGEVLRNRVMMGIIPALDSTLVEDVSEIGGQFQPATVVESSTGKYVAIVPITYPMPAIQADDSLVTDEMGGQVYTKLWTVLVLGRNIQLYLAHEILP